MIAAAHRWAGRSRWLETMEILTCVSHTPALRRTRDWIFAGDVELLDNAKLHVEDPSLAASGFADDSAGGEDGSDDGEDGGATGFAQAVAEAEAEAEAEEARKDRRRRR